MHMTGCFNKTLFVETGQGPDLSQGYNWPILAFRSFLFKVFKPLPCTNLKHPFCRPSGHHPHFTEEKTEAQGVASLHFIDKGRSGISMPSQNLQHWPLLSQPQAHVLFSREEALGHTHWHPGEHPGNTGSHPPGCTLFSTPPCAGCNQAESAGGPALPWEWEELPPGLQPCPGW